MAKLKIILNKSLIGRKSDHISTIHALGLRKIRDIVEFNDSTEVRGMIKKVEYLLKVEEIQ